MKQPPTISFGSLLAQMALFVLLGVPLVAYLWETLNQILALQANLMRILIAIPLLLLFVGLLVLLARSTKRWTRFEES